MQDILVVVDMQNDFIDGALGTKRSCRNRSQSRRED